MTAIDRWLGKPLCAVLTGVRRLAQFVGRTPSYDEPPRSILFVKMAEQGATVLAYRALCRGVELVGRENVYFWVFQENREILDLLDVIPPANVITVRSKNLITFTIDILRSLWRIRRLGIDATVDMEFLARAPAVLAFLTGAPRRVGLHRFTVEGPCRGDLLTHRVRHNPYLHTAAASYVFVEALRSSPADVPLLVSVPPVDGSPPEFRPSDEECRRLRALLEQLAPRTRRLADRAVESECRRHATVRKWPHPTASWSWANASWRAGRKRRW